MSNKLNWGRKGPPRPGSSSVEPRTIERPLATPQEKAERAVARADAEKARQARMKLFNQAVRLEPVGLALEQRQERGEPLSFWDRVNLKRWREIRGCFQGKLPPRC